MTVILLCERFVHEPRQRSYFLLRCTKFISGEFLGMKQLFRDIQCRKDSEGHRRLIRNLRMKIRHHAVDVLCSFVCKLLIVHLQRIFSPVNADPYALGFHGV